MGIIIIADHASQLRINIYAVVIWIILFLQLVALQVFGRHKFPSENLGATIFIIFVTYFLFPVVLRITAFLSIFISLFHLIVSTAISLSVGDVEGKLLARMVCIYVLGKGKRVCACMCACVC